ncbi:MAG: hypothetical protein QXS02_06040 [Candidatus Thermoplasmatota archaeon]
MGKKSTAFAPGHISGFFEPVYHSTDPQRSGSRGSGINVTLGAYSEVTAVESDEQRIDVLINNKPSDAPVTRYALSYLLNNKKYHLVVNTHLDLPVSYGFGMSAAGALSASLALANILSLTRDEAIKASHIAEICSHTGLGDVISSSFGGVEIRREPGLPPYGMIEHIPGQFDIVIAVIGSELETKTVLSDSVKLNDLATHGRYCLKKLLESPSIKSLFLLSQVFTWKSGLAHKKVIDAITTANRYGMASMCMLGNSVFAVGDTENLCEVLCQFGKVWVCNVDVTGARIIN